MILAPQQKTQNPQGSASSNAGVKIMFIDPVSKAKLAYMEFNDIDQHINDFMNSKTNPLAMMAKNMLNMITDQKHFNAVIDAYNKSEAIILTVFIKQNNFNELKKEYGDLLIEL